MRLPVSPQVHFFGERGGTRTHKLLSLNQNAIPIRYPPIMVLQAGLAPARLSGHQFLRLTCLLVPTLEDGGSGWNCTTGVSYVADLQSAALAAGLLTLIWHPHQESDPDRKLRRFVFYPLNYRGKWRCVKDSNLRNISVRQFSRLLP